MSDNRPMEESQSFRPVLPPVPSPTQDAGRTAQDDVIDLDARDPVAPPTGSRRPAGTPFEVDFEFPPLDCPRCGPSTDLLVEREDAVEGFQQVNDVEDLRAIVDRYRNEQLLEVTERITHETCKTSLRPGVKNFVLVGMSGSGKSSLLYGMHYAGSDTTHIGPRLTVTTFDRDVRVKLLGEADKTFVNRLAPISTTYDPLQPIVPYGLRFRSRIKMQDVNLHDLAGEACDGTRRMFADYGRLIQNADCIILCVDPTVTRNVDDLPEAIYELCRGADERGRPKVAPADKPVAVVISKADLYTTAEHIEQESADLIDAFLRRSRDPAPFTDWFEWVSWMKRQSDVAERLLARVSPGGHDLIRSLFSNVTFHLVSALGTSPEKLADNDEQVHATGPLVGGGPTGSVDLSDSGGQDSEQRKRFDENPYMLAGVLGPFARAFWAAYENDDQNVDGSLFDPAHDLASLNNTERPW